MGRPAGTALWEGFLDACGLLEERPMACDPCPNCREGNTAGCTKPPAIEAARQQGFAAGVEAALKVAIEADACVVCGGALLEEYPPYCEDTCRDGWHDYMDEHGDEHPSATTRIRALLAELDPHHQGR